MEDYPIEIKKKIKILLKEIRIQKIKETQKSEDIIWTYSEIGENNNELPENDIEVNFDNPGYDKEVINDLSDDDKEGNNEIPENDIKDINDLTKNIKKDNKELPEKDKEDNIDLPDYVKKNTRNYNC